MLLFTLFYVGGIENKVSEDNDKTIERYFIYAQSHFHWDSFLYCSSSHK